MADKILNFEDGSPEGLMKDSKDFIISHSNKPKLALHGQAEIYNQFGTLLQKKDNIILLGGRRFVLEKLFNVEIKQNRKVLLNDLFNIGGSEPTSDKTGPIQEKQVCLWGVGNGGSSLTFGDVNVPAEKEYNLYNMIPMRYVAVENDLSDEEKKKYYLRVPSEDGNYIAYYLKTFEDDPKLVIKIGENEYIPNLDTDNLPTNFDEAIEREDVDIYVQLTLKLSADDVREYYIETSSGGINNARINELGIYFGYNPGLAVNSSSWEDYVGIEDFSKLCFNNEPLDDETKELTIIYKFFI
jgi:hypothetical protein